MLFEDTAAVRSCIVSMYQKQKRVLFCQKLLTLTKMKVANYSSARPFHELDPNYFMT